MHKKKTKKNKDELYKVIEYCEFFEYPISNINNHTELKPLLKRILNLVEVIEKNISLHGEFQFDICNFDFMKKRDKELHSLFIEKLQDKLIDLDDCVVDGLYKSYSIESVETFLNFMGAYGGGEIILSFRLKTTRREKKRSLDE